MTHVIVPYPDVCHNPIASSGARYRTVVPVCVAPTGSVPVFMDMDWVQLMSAAGLCLAA